METRALYYRHSGTVGLLGPLTMIGLGVLGAVLLGGLYGYVTYYMPLIYFNVVATFMFGVLMGLVVGIGARLGKVRSQFYAGWIGFLLGFFALYCSWISWIHAMTDQSVVIFELGELIDVASVIMETGAWSVFGLVPTGFSLGIVWLIEALVIVGGSAIFAPRSIQKTPYCEACGRWVEVCKSICPLTNVPRHKRDKLRDSVERGDFAMLDALELVPKDKKMFSELRLTACFGCHGLHTMTFASIFETDGRSERSEEKIVDNLIVDQSTYDHLAQHWRVLLVTAPRVVDASGEVGGARRGLR